MLYKDDAFLNDKNNHSEQNANKPNAYRVDDDKNVEEKDLIRSMAGNSKTKPIREGQPMGGENFGANNITPSGDDKNNPSQNAGYSNEYFRRTEPSEEHPENNNFKAQDQQSYQEGTADNDGNSNAKPNIPGPNELPDQQKVGEDSDDGWYHVET
ncbi:hypothetical protein [Mucilaginibacter sp.]|uniref:hypothetical protein n=1 Tax=Mucilaginibacter sp. TaxID=1882438 RepID=UPI00263701C3|nr:hypothetical protein [Mucilaginibacter sp.]MDB5029642.1 hypothetical protein [Mucilaginibacter sp.]